MAQITKKQSGNKTTEIIIGSGAIKMEAVLKGMQGVMEVMGKLPETIQQSTLEVSNLEDKIGGLKQQYENDLAQNKINLKNAYDLEKEGFVRAYCNEKGVILVVGTDYEKMQSDLTEATKNVAETVNKAVNAATGAMKKDHDNALAMSKLEFEKKEADNAAAIKQMTSQIKFLEEQVGHWKGMLETQQKNETERAKASQIGTMNIGTQR